MVILKTKTGMIPANETEIVFTDVNIEDSSIIEIYYDDNNVYTVESWQSGDDVHIITSPHSNQVGVKLLINNVDSFTPYDDTNVKQRVSTLESDVVTIDNLVTTLETDVETLETRVDGLNASNINYDEHSTLYSAMGDIDSLETTSKNLVDAINEVKESGGGGQSYSTTEQIIGTWIDGKNLYRRVVMFNRDANIGANQWNIISEINITNIKYITRCVISNSYGTLYVTDATRNISPYLNIRPYTGISIDANDSFLIVEYTKITD